MDIVLKISEQLTTLRRVLGKVHLLMLGASKDDVFVPPQLADVMCVYGVDAVNPDMTSEAKLLKVAIAATPGKAIFHERAFAQCSSLVNPRPESIVRYGLEKFFTVIHDTEVECVTVNDLAVRHQVPHWDLLKSDLEGIDFAILKSLGESIDKISVISMELRWEPFYEGEPYLHEVVAYLHGHGFRVLDLTLNRWRGKTEHWLAPTRAHATYSDVTFYRIGDEPQQRLRQALLLGLQGYVNFAEQILTRAPFANPEEQAAATELLDFFFGSVTEEVCPMPGMPHIMSALA